MDWTNAMCFEFLKAYETKSLIWNPKDVDHKNRNAVNDAWVNIQQELSFSCTINELKKKKESLMSTFRPLLSKVKSSMKTANGADDVYKPNWFAYDTMAKFLANVYRPRLTISIQESEDEPISDNEIDNVDINSTEENSANLNSPPVKMSKCPGETENVSRKRKSNIDIRLLQTRMDDAYSIMKKACEPIQEKKADECSLYTDLLAVKLRALDEKTRDILMHDIDTLYFRAKYSNNINSQHQLHPGHPFHISPQHSFSSQHSPIDTYELRVSPVQTYSHASQHSPANSIKSEQSTSFENN